MAQQVPAFKNLYPIEEFEKRLSNTHLILITEENNRAIGFKCGYQKSGSRNTFYSWMGGVLPSHRQMGVAKHLLREIEKWCKQQGYDTLEFKTLNEHKEMLVFSIKNGFEIVNVVRSDNDEKKRIILQKSID